MSFARYLHEHRSLYIDHRSDDQPSTPGVALPTDDPDAAPRTVSGGGPALLEGRRRTRDRSRNRLRIVRPAFTPSYLAPPLPYVEPWERR